MSSDATQFAQRYLDRLRDVLSEVDPGRIAALIDQLLATREAGGTVYVCGNGGSSATAQHLASDLLITVRSRERPFRAICLSDNVAAFSAVANDYGYESVFSLPLTGRIGRSDLLVVISASGNSPNILAALRAAHAAGAATCALLGFDGGAARDLADVVVHVPTALGEYGPAEDLHAVVKHIVAAYLTARLADAEDPRAPEGS